MRNPIAAQNWLHDPPAALAQRFDYAVTFAGQLMLTTTDMYGGGGFSSAGGGEDGGTAASSCPLVNLMVNITRGNSCVLKINGATLRVVCVCMPVLCHACAHIPGQHHVLHGQHICEYSVSTCMHPIHSSIPMLGDNHGDRTS